MEIKYRTDRKQGPTVVAVLILIGLIFFFSSPNVHMNDPWVWGICVVYLLVVTDLYWGTCISVDVSGVCAISYFLFRSGLNFDQISAIYYHPTWMVGSKARTLSIIGSKNGRKKSINLGTNHFYSLQSLANVVRAVKEHNTGVEMDGPTQELMERYTKDL